MLLTNKDTKMSNCCLLKAKEIIKFVQSNIGNEADCIRTHSFFSKQKH